MILATLYARILGHNWVVDHIVKPYDDKEYCNGVFVDVQQAFDRVWHKGLLAKVFSVRFSTRHNFHP